MKGGVVIGQRRRCTAVVRYQAARALWRVLQLLHLNTRRTVRPETDRLIPLSDAWAAELGINPRTASFRDVVEAWIEDLHHRTVEAEASAVQAEMRLAATKRRLDEAQARWLEAVELRPARW